MQIAAKSGLETLAHISLEFFQQNPSNIVSNIRNLSKNGNLKNPTRIINYRVNKVGTATIQKNRNF
jgi:hypothetical protein